MAERFGGKYSPQGRNGDTPPPPPQPPFHGKRRSKVGGRVNMLFFAAAPLAIAGFTREPLGLMISLAGVGAILLGAWLTREGLRAQEAYEARRVAKRPAIPRKLFGSVAIGAGVALAAIAGSEPALMAGLLGVVAAILHSFAFGLDPMRDKGLEGVDSFQSDRVARVVDEAEAHLGAMRDAILRAGDRGLEGRVDRFVSTARAMFRRVEEDPRDLTAARKYLGVYLLGARDATAKFADLYVQRRDPAVRADYEALLADLETSFAAQTEKMLLDDRSDLDVEIEVLRERLEREGVTAR